MLTITLGGRQSQSKFGSFIGVGNCGVRSFGSPQSLKKSLNDSVKTQKFFNVSGALFLQIFMKGGIEF